MIVDYQEVLNNFLVIHDFQELTESLYYLNIGKRIEKFTIAL